MDLASLKKRLLNPGIYPEKPWEVRSIETHISVIFLTGLHAYKIKKPVNFGFLDFTSLEKRRHFCQEEVTLNRRLAPRIYLGVAEINEKDGRVSWGGEGNVIEYAVKMKQIPEELLLDHLVRQNRVTSRMMEMIAEKLSDFYSLAETSDYITSFGRPGRIKQDTDKNFKQVERYVGLTISAETCEAVKERTNQFLRDRKEVFYRRMTSRRIRDCHGDLRLEHIVWGEEICIIDCIEFNERFRFADLAADIAFLAMDIDYHERPELNEPLLRAYIQRSGDRELIQVLDFYKCYRAFVRGKVESFQWGDPNIPEEKRGEALKRAQRFFDLSRRYSDRF